MHTESVDVRTFQLQVLNLPRQVAASFGILKDGVEILELSRTELDHADLGKIYLDFMKNGRASGQGRHLETRP